MSATIQPKTNRSSNFTMRIEPQKKKSLEMLFKGLGITLADAVNIFFEKSLNVGGIPFDLRINNYDRETFEAMKETLDIESGLIKAKRYKSVDDLFSDNDAELAAEEDR